MKISETRKMKKTKIVLVKLCFVNPVKKYTYGSMGPHRKVCRGFVEPDPMIDLIQSFEKLCL
jgi:hypothetical protein